MQRGNDCAVRERELPFPKGRYRDIVAQLGAQLLEVVSCSRLRFYSLRTYALN